MTGTNKNYPLIALRPDKEFSERIEYLMNLWNCNKSYALRQAVGLSYHYLTCSGKQMGIYCSDCGMLLKLDVRMMRAK